MSCIIAEKALDDAARAIHAEFFGPTVTPEGEGGKRPKAKAAAPKAAGSKRRAARN